MIEQFFDTMIVASSDKEWLYIHPNIWKKLKHVFVSIPFSSQRLILANLKTPL